MASKETDYLCTGGITVNCDDNCLYRYNPAQTDWDYMKKTQTTLITIISLFVVLNLFPCSAWGEGSVVLSVNTGISLYEGDTARISSFELDADAPDNNDDEIIYTIIQQPCFGELLNEGYPTNEFTQEDLNRSSVEYQDFGGNPGTSGFAFRVSVGTEQISDLFPLYIVGLPPDSDGDGILDADDNCPNFFSPSLSDVDADGVGVSATTVQ
jgi:hypothetical protein